MPSIRRICAGRWQGNFHKLLWEAAFYLLATEALQSVGMQLQVCIGEELTEASLNAYERYAHHHVLPPADTEAVRAVVGDGHKKIFTVCRAAGGAPPTTCTASPEEGWFMRMEPVSGRIVALKPMNTPENNEVVTRLLTAILPVYRNVDTLIMDRVCGCKPSAVQNPMLSQLQHYSIDWFHARGHVKHCPCNPRSIKSLARRLGDLNTSICEQTFNWFRKYALALHLVHLETRVAGTRIACIWLARALTVSAGHMRLRVCGVRMMHGHP